VKSKLKKMKKIIGSLSTATFVLCLSIIALINMPVQKASADVCSCKKDLGDTCICYGHTFQDCDETCWLCNNDCGESS
jgi:hypothetical protein